MPTVGGPHLKLVAETASAIATANGATVITLAVVPANKPELDQATATENLIRAVEYVDAPAERRIVEAPFSQKGILDAAEQSDVLIMGGTGTGRIRPPIIGSVARTVAEEVTCPVIIAKRADQSRFQQLLNRL